MKRVIRTNVIVMFLIIGLIRVNVHNSLRCLFVIPFEYSLFLLGVFLFMEKNGNSQSNGVFNEAY